MKRQLSNAGSTQAEKKQKTGNSETEIAKRAKLVRELRDLLTAHAEANPVKATPIGDHAAAERNYQRTSVALLFGEVVEKAAALLPTYIKQADRDTVAFGRATAEELAALDSNPDLRRAWNSDTGTNLFGNAGFGFIIANMQERKHLLEAELANREKIPVEYQPGVKARDDLLRQASEFRAHIISIGALCAGVPEQDVDISLDTMKHVTDRRKGTEAVLTAPHVDVWQFPADEKKDIRRMQALLKSATGPIQRALFVTPYTHLPPVQRLIAELFGVPLKRFQNNGFVGLPQKGNEDAMAVLTEFAVASPGAGAMAWHDGAVHFEAYGRVAPGSDGKLLQVAALKPTIRELTALGVEDPRNMSLYRAICGTHRITVDGTTWRQIRHLARHSVTPSVYYHREYKETRIGANIVNSKTTRFKKYRPLNQREQDAVAAAIASMPKE